MNVPDQFKLSLSYRSPLFDHDLLDGSDASPQPKPSYTLSLRRGDDPVPIFEMRCGTNGVFLSNGAERQLRDLIERANRPDPEPGRPADAARQAVDEAEPPPTVVLSDLTVIVHSDDPETLVQVFYKGDPVAANVVLNQRPPM